MSEPDVKPEPSEEPISSLAEEPESDARASQQPDENEGQDELRYRNQFRRQRTLVRGAG